MNKVTFLFLLITNVLFSQTMRMIRTDLNVNVNFRGLSVVDDSVVWISGAQGYVGRSTNGGKDWDLKQVTGFEKKDFRSLYAFNEKKAIIANAGSPANILITTDGGIHWETVYTNTDTSAFFDGMDFWNEKDGMIYGDPIDGKMLLLSTSDGGLHWNLLPEKSMPLLREGEASFAASGTGIRCIEKEKIMITTGGSVTRLLISANKGIFWDTLQTPVIAGKNSTGIFSVAYLNKNIFTIVGGDYLLDSLKTNHVFYTSNAGKNWIAPITPTRGYRECVEYITSKTVLACGPSGTDLSIDGGKNWKGISDEKSFHVVRKARKGKLIVAVGKGKVCRMQW